jgi:uncharacterized protein
MRSGAPRSFSRSGSYIGMMEREVLGYGAPLYGRRTASYLLAPLRLREAAAFFPQYTPMQQIEAWAVLGGMPYYLSAFTDRVDLFENVRTQILDVRGLLYNEPQLLFMEELREPRNYFSILRGIAHGNTRPNEIAQAAGLSSASTAASYLDTLRQMHLVDRKVPATEGQPEKSKKGIYQIADPFLRFWFRYVHPYRGSLDLGLADVVLERWVRPTFDGFVGYAFEEAARQHVARLAQEEQLPFLPDRIGSWWDRQMEIDVVAVSDSEEALLVGECKWTTRPVGPDLLSDLKAKVRRLDPRGAWPNVTYMLWSKSGFAPTLQEAAQGEGVRLVEPREMV